MLASDMAPMRAVFDGEIMPRNTWDADQAAKSSDEIRRLQRLGATVLFGHDDGQWQTLRKGAHAYS